MPRTVVAQQDLVDAVVGELETPAPDLPRFLLRGTLPIPPGIYPRADGRNPFILLDYDGTPLVTETDVVSRYPDDAQGADVVELLAQVRRDPALSVGAAARYRVRYTETPAPPPVGAHEQIPDSVRDFAFDPSGIEITSFDCFGNKYVAHPLTRGFVQLRSGPVEWQRRFYEDMVPVRPAAGSTLPHFFGVHAYVRLFRNSRTIELDLRFHNGHDGQDRSDPLDDPLGKVYFKRIEVSVPEEWEILQDFADPMSGGERVANGRRIFTLVAPNPNDKLHVIPWLGQFHRRLALAPVQDLAIEAARAQLDGAGRAFCRRGQNAAGAPYWSWWNANTARYFPQRHPLPHLDNVGDAALESSLSQQLGFLRQHLATGTGVGDYPLSAGRLGWAHPYGVPYGGMTSGLEIDCWDGIETAVAASPTGYQLYTALHRMQTDRMPNALYDRNGNPSSVEEFLVENGDHDYVPLELFVVPLLSGSRPDPFGVRNAPRFQVDYVEANGLQPPYEAFLLSFEPHDYQHFVRYTRSAKVLAWLGNDALAIDDLRMEAENFHLSFHSYPRDPSNAAQWSGLLSMIRFVRTYPGNGMPYGRGEAWGMDCVVSAYALLDPEWRARKLPWLCEQIETIADGQGCNGFIQANVSDKAFDGRYRIRQQIEQSITEHVLIGLHETVFRGFDPAHARMTRGVLEKSFYAFISDMAWSAGLRGPWRYSGVGPLDAAEREWCSRADMPSDAFTFGDVDTFQDWSSFAYAFELTGDPIFLRYARIQGGGDDFADLVTYLRNEGTRNIENRAALLALVQQLTGEL